MSPRSLLCAALLLLAACRTSAPDFPRPRNVGYERWKHFHEERAYPNGIPAGARRKALQHVATRERQRVQTDAVRPSWRSLGPTPVETAFPWRWASGRINALAVSPADSQLILAGASSGGVWRSTDGGTSFVPVSDNHADLSIGAIAFAPSDPRVVYAAMGSDFLGTGVLRSDDAGLTWRQVSGATFSQRGRSLRAAVDPSNPDRLWVMQVERQGAGSDEREVGVLRSEDGGVTWTNVLTGYLTDFLHVPGTAQTLLAAVGTTRLGGHTPGVHKSVDGGETWTLIRAAGPFFPLTGHFVLAVSPAQPDRYYAYGSTDTTQHKHTFWISNDAGATWSASPAILPAEMPYYLAADPHDANVVYAGFRDAYQSTDGGITWTNITRSIDANGVFRPDLSTTHVDQHSIAFAPGLLYLGNDGGIFRSADQGRTFTSLSPTLSVIQAYGIAAHPTNPSIAWLGTQDNGLERRSPDGSWRELVTGDYGSIAFDPADPRRVLSNYIEGQMFSIDTSDRFAPVTNNGTWGEPEVRPRIAFIAPFEQSRARGTLYFGTYRLFVSNDFGRTWSAPGGTTDLTSGKSDRLRAIGISDAHPLVIYTGSQNGRVMLSRDGGFNWTNASGRLPQRTIKAFAVDPRDAAVAYVAVSGYGTDHVFVTRDFGANWTALGRELPDVPVNALLLDPRNPDVLLAGTDIGVFRVEGDGAWELFNDGMPHVLISDFDVTADGRVIVATYGRGAYQLVQPPASGGGRRRAVGK